MSEDKPHFRFTRLQWDGTEISMKIHHDQIDSILQEFEQFLRGCGFVFSGRLEISGDGSYWEDDASNAASWSHDKTTNTTR